MMIPACKRVKKIHAKTQKQRQDRNVEPEVLIPIRSPGHLVP